MENEGEEDGREREARNEKAFTLCEKRRAEGKVEKIPRKSVRSRIQNEERREKSGLRGAKKRARSLEKSPEIGFETGKSGKNGDFGAKKVGWGSGGKMGFTADFAML